jgi:hypothetical protein
MMAENDVDADPVAREKKRVQDIVVQLKQLLKDAETSGYGDTAEGKALHTKFKALQAQLYKYSNTDDAHRIGEYNHKGGYVSNEFRELVWRTDLVQSVWYDRQEAEKERIEAQKPKSEPPAPAPKPKRKANIKKKAEVKVEPTPAPTPEKKTIVLTDTIPDVVFFNSDPNLTTVVEPTLVISELPQNTIVQTPDEDNIAPDEHPSSLPPSTIAVIEAQRKADKMTSTVNTHWNPDSIPLIRDALTNMGRKLRSTDKVENKWFEVEEHDGRMRPYSTVDGSDIPNMAYTQPFCDEKIAFYEAKVKALNDQIVELDEEARLGKFYNVSRPFTSKEKKERNAQVKYNKVFKDEDKDDDPTLYNKYLEFEKKSTNLKRDRTAQSSKVSHWLSVKTSVMTWLPKRIVQFDIRYNDHNVPMLREFFKANDRLPFYNQLSQIIELRHEDMATINKSRSNPIRNVHLQLLVKPSELYILTTWEVNRYDTHQHTRHQSKGTEYNLGIYGDTVVKKFKSYDTLRQETKDKEAEDDKALDKVIGADGLVHREKGGFSFSFRINQKHNAKYDALWYISSYDIRKLGNDGEGLKKVVSNYTTEKVMWDDDKTRSWKKIDKDPSNYIITGYKVNGNDASVSIAGYTYFSFEKKEVGDGYETVRSSIVFPTPVVVNVKLSKKKIGASLPEWIKPMPYDKETDYSAFK